MKVLIVAHSTKLSGGSNRSLLSIIDKMCNENNHVEVILPKKYGAMYDELEKRKVKTHYIAYGQIYGGKKLDKNRFLRTVIMNCKMIHDQIKSYFYSFKIRKDNFDVIYTNTSLPFFGGFLAKYLNIPHIWHCREFIYPKEDILPHNVFKKMAMLSQKVIVISSAMKEAYKEVGEDKLQLIYNGIELNTTDPIKCEHTGYNIIQVARIVEAKGQHDAIKAMNIVVKKGYKDIVLHFAGSPINKNSKYYLNLKEMINQYNLQNNIKFCGEIDGLKELRSIMDLELMCSKCEAFGRVTIEAMRSNILVVGTNSGGTKDIIKNNETGLLYEPGNYEELAELILYAYNNKNEVIKIANNGFRYSTENFTAQQFKVVCDLLKGEVSRWKR